MLTSFTSLSAIWLGLYWLLDANIPTSGKPLTLSCTVDDPDDTEGNFRYTWSLPDYPPAHPAIDLTNADDSPVITVYHETPLSQVSVYTLSLQVTDSDDKISAPFETQIIVSNTVAGRLYDDEYWAPENSIPHKLLGTVIVPAEYSLSIAENAVIEVAADFLTGGYSLIVEGNLEMKNNSTLRIESAALLEYWKGIYVSDGGNAVLNGATVRNAERGITINRSASVVLNDTAFDGNQVGIHNLKAGQAINGCVIQNSYYYGIKEEAGAIPTLTGNWFNGNYIDYYDADDTATSMVELNGAGRN